MAAKTPLTREAVVGAIVGVLEPQKSSLALWEQGAASFDRIDAFSDIDLCLVVDEGGVEKAFKAVEKVLSVEFGIGDKFRVPEPAWHGSSQCLYWLKGASPFLFVDMAVMKRSSKSLFLERSIHGPPVVRFDKIGITADTSPLPKDFAKKLEERLGVIKTMFQLFQVEVLKEIERGNELEALSFYNSMVLRPLVEALRIKHCPWRHNFHTRYVYYDLPEDVVKRLRGLFFVLNGKDLAAKRAEAEEWFWDTIDDIEGGDVEGKLAETAHRTAKKR